MKISCRAILVFCAFASALGAIQRERFSLAGDQRERMSRVAEGWDVLEKDTIRQTLPFSQPSGSKKVRVDNLHGSITIAGYEGSDG